MSYIQNTLMSRATSKMPQDSSLWASVPAHFKHNQWLSGWSLMLTKLNYDPTYCCIFPSAPSTLNPRHWHQGHLCKIRTVPVTPLKSFRDAHCLRKHGTTVPPVHLLPPLSPSHVLLQSSHPPNSMNCSQSWDVSVVGWACWILHLDFCLFCSVES